VVRDNGGLSATNTFEVVVNEVNEAPMFVVTPADQVVAEQTSMTVTNEAADADLPAQLLTYELIEAPAGAQIDVNGVISWMPGEAQGPSTNSFTTTATDGVVSITNSFVVAVMEVNEAPVAVDDSYLVANASLTVAAPGVLVNDSDADLPANGLTANLVVGPTSGVLNLSSDGGFTYTPDVAFNGVDSFTYLTDDGLTSSPPATVTLVVSNRLFRITSIVASGGVATVRWNSLAGRAYRLLYKEQLEAADWNVVPGDVTASGLTSSKTNLVGAAAQRFYRVMVVSNQPPTLTVQANRLVDELGSLTVTNAASDPDWPTELLTYELVGGPTNATISSGGVISWTPTEAQGPSTNTLTTVVTDNGGLSATNTFEVVVNEVNEAPVFVATPANQVVAEQTLMTVTNAATDADLPVQLLAYQLIEAPAGAQIDPSGVITWTPGPGVTGTTNLLRTRVTDSGSPARSATNVFLVTVIGVNEPPVAQDDEYDLGGGLSLNVPAPGVLINDLDGDGDPLSALLVTPPTRGVVVLSTNGGFTYTPTNHFIGVDRFTYRAADGQTNSGLATVSITVSNQFRITSIVLSNGSAVVRWTSIPGLIYQLQYQDSLGDGEWTSVSPGVTATGPITSLTNVVVGISKRLYRVELLRTLPAPRIESIGVSGGVVTIAWKAVAGQDYQLEYKDRLSDPLWTPVSGLVTAEDSLASQTNLVSGAAQRVYRVALLPR